MVKSCKQCGWLAAATLVLLRLAIGIHFFQEGGSKLSDPRPFSAGFFANAKGPLAPAFKGMVWDPDGRVRLGLPADNDPSLAGVSFKPDYNAMLNHWESYRNRVTGHYAFDDKQVKEAERITQSVAGRYRGYLGSKSEEIEEYYQRLLRRDAYAQKPERNLESLQAHDAANQADLLKLRGPLLATIDGMSKDLERRLNEIASEDQRRNRGWLGIGRAGEQPVSAETVDKLIPYFDLAVGVCLIVGLLTRTAAVLGGLFLLSVCATQFPGYPGSAPIYYQAVESLALFALAANGAGKWMSVDSMLRCCRSWCCPSKAPQEGDKR